MEWKKRCKLMSVCVCVLRFCKQMFVFVYLDKPSLFELRERREEGRRFFKVMMSLLFF